MDHPKGKTWYSFYELEKYFHFYQQKFQKQLAKHHTKPMKENDELYSQFKYKSFDYQCKSFGEYSTKSKPAEENDTENSTASKRRKPRQVISEKVGCKFFINITLDKKRKLFFVGPKSCFDAHVEKCDEVNTSYKIPRNCEFRTEFRE